MGLLSDPSIHGHRSQFSRNLAKHSSKICLVFYIAGLIWFVALAHPDFNHGTYLSENALSPGLVYLEMKQDSSRLAQSLVEELQREREERPSTTPHAWIAAKMKQIGLETHMHNFTLRYPFAGGKEYHGKNVYGILRAPRISSTEGIVISAPYRPSTSVHEDISASVPVLLAFADFARRKNYWAKDIIFLVTEQEQLGMHAWLEAYYEGGIHDSSILQCGNLPARAGALQAALNLEIQGLDIDYVDVKIEGLNGQLPNLDMFNLVQRITSREGVSSGYKQTPNKKKRGSAPSIEENLWHMIKMLLSQTTGIPNGNHGLFHRYRIESLTLEAVKRSNNNNQQRYTSALPILKVIEGILRSLNNLLERFHQSYFFYILVQNDRFVSIGDYMPCLGFLAGPLFIKAFLLWLSLGEIDEEESKEAINNADDKETCKKRAKSLDLPYAKVLMLVGISGALGALCNAIPLNPCIRDYFVDLNVSTASMITILLTAITFVAAALPFLVRLTPDGKQLIHIGALLSLAVALIVMGLLNFSLGFLIALVSVPLVILLPKSFTQCNKLRLTLIRLYALLLNPLILISCIVLILTRFQFEELGAVDVFWRAFAATKDAITFALMDRIIYGNWLYTFATAVFFPIWILFWILAVTPISRISLKQKMN